MRDNDLYEAILREMHKVKAGDKCPENAAFSVMNEFSRESIYVSTRFLRHARLGEKVLKLRNSGIGTSEIAERLGISKRHARRLYAAMLN
ncbi:hypothetical protein [Maridesulfovibrio sp.]|uniref:hypothetical protein n=1 Tax=Maridesulfovibrio sp. TaxID=2795000 RepID=UPI002A187F2B|nr:hypothetical protein [Maridesulfovibrio sp.]